MQPNNPYLPPEPPSGNPYGPPAPNRGTVPNASGPVNGSGGWQPQMPQMPQYGAAPNTYGQPQFGPPMPQQPPQTAVPYFLDPNGPYGPLHSNVPPKKVNRKLPMIVVGVAALLILGTVIAMFTAGGGQGNASADAIFQQALQHSLATTSYTQATNMGQDDHGYQFDMRETTDPKLNANIKLADFNLSYNGYGDLKNTYVEFTKTDGSSISDTIQNKWVQVRKAGTLPTADRTLQAVAPTVDPQNQLFGPYIRGNFSDSDRQEILSLIQEKQLYAYSVDNASTSVVGGTAVYTYNVTINSDALKELNHKVADIWGIDSKVVDASDAANEVSSATFYVSINDQQLVKMEYKQGDSTVSSTFSNFNNTKISSEPSADMQWADVELSSAQNADSKRKLQLGSIAVQLETYFAKNKQYPSLADLNSADFFKKNFPNFNTTRLQDPNGATQQLAAEPVKNQFAYKNAADKSLAPCGGKVLCKYYALSAILEDGSVYVQQSQ